MIEGKVPICHLLDHYAKVDRESVITLLFRVQKLLAAKHDVTRILNILFKIYHDPRTPNREKLAARLLIMVE
jgi:hypothetical protein